VKFLTRLSRRRDEIGATAIIVALFFAFVALPLGAIGVDVARLYVELQRVQAAADAAALQTCNENARAALKGRGG
jgi:uncharacterized membrane protein